jgi:hypothetical protein
MSEDDALTEIKAMTAWDTDPVLTLAEVTRLRNKSRIEDRWGVWPLNTDGTLNTSWEPTYNLNIGAAEGWRWKASRAESIPSGAVTSIRVGDVAKTYATAAERFTAKAEMYAKKVSGSVRVSNVPPGLNLPWGIDI